MSDTAVQLTEPPEEARATTANVSNANAAAANANVAAANANAAAANANMAAAGAPASGSYPMGSVHAALPAGCIQPNVSGGTYYLCGNTWFSPAYGANGVHYTVVPTP